MKNIRQLSTRVAITLLTSSVCACVVTPKKVASYDEKCMVSTHKIELTVEQINLFNDVHCISNSCKMELTSALVTSALTTATSAVVSGSIALLGNTLYWAESKGKCPNFNHPEQPSPNRKPVEIDEKYLIQEEIITVRS